MPFGLLLAFLLWGRFSSSENSLLSSVFGAVTALAGLRIIPSVLVPWVLFHRSPKHEEGSFPTDHRNSPCLLLKKVPLSVLPSWPDFAVWRLYFLDETTGVNKTDTNHLLCGSCLWGSEAYILIIFWVILISQCSCKSLPKIILGIIRLVNDNWIILLFINGMLDIHYKWCLHGLCNKRQGKYYCK